MASDKQELRMDEWVSDRKVEGGGVGWGDVNVRVCLYAGVNLSYG